MQTGWLQSQDEQIYYSAGTFRRLLDSLARPGILNQLALPAFLGQPPVYTAGPTKVSLNLYALGALLTLVDGEQTAGIMLDGQWQTVTSPVFSWLSVRTGVSWAEPAAINFALFEGGQSGGKLAELKPGSLLEPEDSATAIYSVEELATGQGDPAALTLRLTGPGIQTEHWLSIKGLEVSELALFQATRAHFPLGIDIFLVDRAGRVAGLPRTTRLARQG